MGYSIGVVNATALAFDRLPQTLARWRQLGALDALKPRPRLRPFSLCSAEPLRSFFNGERDDEKAKAALKIALTMIAACPAEGAALNARFTPGGHGGWDGPFVEQAAASCAIPLVFPPVDLDYRGRRVRLIDGGVPMRAPLDFSPFARCADVLVLEMVRADEMGRRAIAPWRALDQGAREAGRRLIDGGLNELLMKTERPPRVFRLAPSRRLEPMMLDFRAAGLRGMLALGAVDAKAFLSGFTSSRK
jgi:hypothetical protein